MPLLRCFPGVAGGGGAGPAPRTSSKQPALSNRPPLSYCSEREVRRRTPPTRIPCAQLSVPSPHEFPRHAGPSLRPLPVHYVVGTDAAYPKAVSWTCWQTVRQTFKAQASQTHSCRSRQI